MDVRMDDLLLVTFALLSPTNTVISCDIGLLRTSTG